MSTILEALRRLEREHRQPGNALSLREAVADGAAVERASAPGSWRATLLALLLGVGLGAGLLLLWVGDTDSGDGAGAKAAPSPAQRDVTRLSGPPVTVPTVVLPPPAAPAPRPEPDVAVLARPPAAPRSPIEWSTGDAFPEPEAVSGRSKSLAPPRGPAAPAPRRADRPPPPEAPPQPRIAAASPAATTASPAATTASPAATTASPAATTASRESPLSVQVERTLWHPDAERRQAFLRLPGRTATVSVQEGEQLGAFTVRHIEPSRVIFEAEGVQVTRPVETR